ncbi:MAG TPA: glycosyltransferase family 1 protein [Candidatus Limnocylindria bacterium]|nr:glycosyltransferase family 1 protein [Candidatus Limnocylindria bacterium]
MTTTKPLRICIDARASHGVVGGVQQVVAGIVGGLSALRDGAEEYLVLADESTAAWLPRLPAERWRIEPVATASATAAAGQKPGIAMRTARRVADRLLEAPLLCRTLLPALQRSDGLLERLGVDLVHFPTQIAFLTSVPSIYHPHDLQHLHLPELFSRRTAFLRERAYRTFCGQARMVAVASTWTRDDLVSRYGLQPEKVQVVPLAPATEPHALPGEEAADAFLRVRGLPRSFVFYPAQTWPHKNHLALLEALGLLRRRGLRVPLVCSGHLNSFYPTIRRRARALGIDAHVHFLGFVTPGELQCLYRACRAVVIPTLFEAASFPLWEAFLAGAPAACSNVTSLPAQAGDAALVFDPKSASEIADAIYRLWTDEPLRSALAERGRRSVARFTWERTARLFRAHYRRLTGRPLGDADSAALAAAPLL